MFATIPGIDGVGGGGIGSIRTRQKWPTCNNWWQAKENCITVPITQYIIEIKQSVRQKWHNQIFHPYLWLLLRCCSVWLSETGQHMPLICVYRSHVFYSIDFSVSYNNALILNKWCSIARWFIYYPIVSTQEVNITISLQQKCRTTLKIRGKYTCRTCIHSSRP